MAGMTNAQAQNLLNYGGGESGDNKEGVAVINGVPLTPSYAGDPIIGKAFMDTAVKRRLAKIVSGK
jgi:hypothetical protein